MKKILASLLIILATVQAISLEAEAEAELEFLSLSDFKKKLDNNPNVKTTLKQIADKAEEEIEKVHHTLYPK